MPSLDPDRPIQWRARPLLLAAGCVSFGIVVATRLPDVGYFGWAGMAVAGALVAALVAGLPRRRLVSLRPLGWTLALGIALAGLGGARTVLWHALPYDHVAHLAVEADDLPDPVPLTLVGRVTGAPSATERRLRFVLEADSAGLEQFFPVSGHVEVTLWPPFDPEGPVVATSWPELHPGHHVAVTGRLRPPLARRNPADMDYGAFLRRQGLHAVLSGSDSTALQVLGYTPTRFERVVTGARAHVRRTLDTHVRHDEARGVLQALLLADRSGVARETREAFALTGLAHLLAVSGLHVLLVGMVLYGVLKPFLHRFGWSWRRVEVARAGLTLLLLGAYVTIVGGPASAVRALVMAALLIGGRVVERPSNALNALGAAALLLLMARPVALFDVGFQLSFAAVGGLVLLMPGFERRLPEPWRRRPARRYMAGLVLASAAATLSTMPVLLYHFGRVPLAGVVLNVVAIPATALALSAALVAVACAAWLPAAADLAGAAAELGAWIVLATGAEGVRWLGWTAVGTVIRDGWMLAALVAVVAALAFWERPRLRWRCVIVALALGTVSLWLPLRDGAARPSLEIVFFDVGQGDAALLRLPNGRHVLVDAGPRDPFSDAGVRTLLPHLARYGIRRLDAIVVSHPHADHMGGAPALLREVEVGRLLHSGEAYPSLLYAETKAWAQVRGVPTQALQAGDTLALDPNVRLHVLHPGPEPDAHTNDGSVVLLVQYGQTSFLLTGDVEAEAETTLAGRYGHLLCADVVKVPHHGSRTSSTPDFVAAATSCGRAAKAIVPVARRNRYRHPNEEALDRWRAAGARVLLTHEEGAVWLRSDGRRIWRVDWR
jgi:competence protein ComEC